MPSSQEGIRCKLCGSHSDVFWIDEVNTITYYKCTQCHSVFQGENSYVSEQQEIERYRNHENDVNDERYQDFVSPITDAVIEHFKPQTHSGLDFGCGTGPVISHLLNAQGFDMTLYDPFFYPDESYLNRTYDFIACCEVMEHFHHPDIEFEKLRSLLKTNGRLYCKTALVSNEITADVFSNWYYKNDPTHVFLYAPKALEYIRNAFDFSNLIMSEKLITFSV